MEEYLQIFWYVNAKTIYIKVLSLCFFSFSLRKTLRKVLCFQICRFLLSKNNQIKNQIISLPILNERTYGVSWEQKALCAQCVVLVALVSPRYLQGLIHSTLNPIHIHLNVPRIVKKEVSNWTTVYVTFPTLRP